MNGVGRLAKIEGRMTPESYIDLCNNLLGTVGNLGENTLKIVFQHDNTPKHTAKATPK